MALEGVMTYLQRLALRASIKHYRALADQWRFKIGVAPTSERKAVCADLARLHDNIADQLEKYTNLL